MARRVAPGREPRHTGRLMAHPAAQLGSVAASIPKTGVAGIELASRLRNNGCGGSLAPRRTALSPRGTARASLSRTPSLVRTRPGAIAVKPMRSIGIHPSRHHEDSSPAPHRARAAGASPPHRPVRAVGDPRCGGRATCACAHGPCSLRRGEQVRQIGPLSGYRQKGQAAGRRGGRLCHRRRSARVRMRRGAPGR